MQKLFFASSDHAKADPALDDQGGSKRLGSIKSNGVKIRTTDTAGPQKTKTRELPATSRPTGTPVGEERALAAKRRRRNNLDHPAGKILNVNLISCYL
jgi:hypothetical protein